MLALRSKSIFVFSRAMETRFGAVVSHESSWFWLLTITLIEFFFSCYYSYCRLELFCWKIFAKMPANPDKRIFVIEKFLRKLITTIITIKPLKFFVIVFFAISNIHKYSQKSCVTSKFQCTEGAYIIRIWAVSNFQRLKLESFCNFRALLFGTGIW